MVGYVIVRHDNLKIAVKVHSEFGRRQVEELLGNEVVDYVSEADFEFMLPEIDLVILSVYGFRKFFGL